MGWPQIFGRPGTCRTDFLRFLGRRGAGVRGLRRSGDDGRLRAQAAVGNAHRTASAAGAPPATVIHVPTASMTAGPPWTEVSAGASDTCGIRADGSCGAGVPSPTDSSAPVSTYPGWTSRSKSPIPPGTGGSASASARAARTPAPPARMTPGTPNWAICTCHCAIVEAVILHAGSAICAA
jgi:hypothetical protein